MEARRLEGMRIAAIMTDGFEQIEFTSPKEALTREGAIVNIVSPAGRHIQGLNHYDRADEFEVDEPLDQANPDEYDAVLLPGGVINGDQLRVNKTAQDFIRHINDRNKPISVICHGPWLLVSAGIVRGRRMTSYHTLQDDLRNAGAQWVDEPVVVDDNLISSRGPDDLPQFNQKTIEKLSQASREQAYRVAEIQGEE